MGELSKFSIKGLAFKTGEGELNMGREGTIFNDTTANFENPWKFSSMKEDGNKISQHAGQYVWISYNESNVAGVKYNTAYMVTDIQAVTKVEPKAFETKNASGSKSEGFRVGRIVKASYKGVAAKTYEIIFQEGNAGNRYTPMSTNDKDMYEALVEWLKSGKKCKVSYLDSYIHNPLTQSTGYNISKVEPLGDI